VIIINDEFEECRTKMAVFWVVALCSLIALMMEAASTSETSVNCYQTTLHNPEDLHTRRRENLKSQSEHCLKVVDACKLISDYI
jgi:hypothetical protein